MNRDGPGNLAEDGGLRCGPLGETGPSGAGYRAEWSPCGSVHRWSWSANFKKINSSICCYY